MTSLSGNSGRSSVLVNSNTDDSLRDLRGRSVRGVAMTVAGQGAQFLLDLLSVIILARLLVPEDFGLFAMVGAVLGLVGVLQNSGLPLAILQSEKLEHGQMNTVFWMHLLFSVLLVTVVVVGSPLMAYLYGEPRLTLFAAVMSLTLLLQGLALPQRALLRRQMRFGPLVTAQVTAQVCSIVIAVWFAWRGAGYWSLAVKMIAGQLCLALLCWGFSHWRPSFPSFAPGSGRLLRFGGYVTGGELMTYAVRNADDLFIGMAWGAVSLGFYNRAYRLLLIPLKQVSHAVSTVALPVLSRLQRDPPRFKRYYMTGLTALASALLPCVVFAAVKAEALVLLVLGDQWSAVVPVFKAFIPAAVVSVIGVGTGWAFIPLGHSDRKLRSNIIGGTATLVGFAFGLQWGAVGVAWSLSMTSVLKSLPQLAYAFRGTGMRLRDVGMGLWRPVWAVALAVLFMSLFDRWLCLWIPLELLVHAPVFLTVYCLALFGLPGGRAELRRWLTVLRECSGEQWADDSVDCVGDPHDG
ncbi:MAG: lipopolysaccharide biosynthesis protein [Candidatus Pacebacteria bacterium]|nr:lipopolysaccharide biosynthesis protein [Candidatus Paceibacterota bacterium]